MSEQQIPTYSDIYNTTDLEARFQADVSRVRQRRDDQLSKLKQQHQGLISAKEEAVVKAKAELERYQQQLDKLTTDARQRNLEIVHQWNDIETAMINNKTAQQQVIKARGTELIEQFGSFIERVELDDDDDNIPDIPSVDESDERAVTLKTAAQSVIDHHLKLQEVGRKGKVSQMTKCATALQTCKEELKSIFNQIKNGLEHNTPPETASPLLLASITQSSPVVHRLPAGITQSSPPPPPRRHSSSSSSELSSPDADADGAAAIVRLSTSATPPSSHKRARTEDEQDDDSEDGHDVIHRKKKPRTCTMTLKMSFMGYINPNGPKAPVGLQRFCKVDRVPTFAVTSSNVPGSQKKESEDVFLNGLLQEILNSSNPPVKLMHPSPDDLNVLTLSLCTQDQNTGIIRQIPQSKYSSSLNETQRFYISHKHSVPNTKKSATQDELERFFTTITIIGIEPTTGEHRLAFASLFNDILLVKNPSSDAEQAHNDLVEKWRMDIMKVIRSTSKEGFNDIIGSKLLCEPTSKVLVNRNILRLLRWPEPKDTSQLALMDAITLNYDGRDTDDVPFTPYAPRYYRLQNASPPPERPSAFTPVSAKMKETWASQIVEPGVVQKKTYAGDMHELEPHFKDMKMGILANMKTSVIDPSSICTSKFDDVFQFLDELDIINPKWGAQRFITKHSKHIFNYNSSTPIYNYVTLAHAADVQFPVAFIIDYYNPSAHSHTLERHGSCKTGFKAICFLRVDLSSGRVSVFHKNHKFPSFMLSPDEVLQVVSSIVDMSDPAAASAVSKVVGR